MSEAAREREIEEHREQYWILMQIENWLEMPMFVLSIVWVLLLGVELAWEAHPLVLRAITVIWVIFVLEFVLKFVIAPNRLRFLRKSWLTAFALVIPALRVFRVAQVARVLRAGRAIRGITLARVLTAFNRGLRTLRQTMGRFGFSYVLMLTLLVAMLGTTGMYWFERDQPAGIHTIGDALWFTGMMLTTSGSDYWPQSLEGRILGFLLALYAFAIFGYVTATLATLLVGQEARSRRILNVDAQAIAALQAEIASLHERIASPPVAGVNAREGG